MTDDQARETPLYSFMPTGSHELRVSVYPGSVEMHNDGRVIRKPIVEWMKDCVALSESVDTAHAHYQPQIDQCIKEINELRAACAEANEAYRRKTDYAEAQKRAVDGQSSRLPTFPRMGLRTMRTRSGD
jgi:hypothetical protein